MRVRFFLPICVAAVLLMPASASAYFSHVIGQGESLTSIAATDGLTVDQLAAANGISPGSELISGESIQIPPQEAGLSTVAPTETQSDGETVGTATPTSGGSYVVQPGDTLTAIAERAGVSIDSLAAANGLNPDGILLAGADLSLSGSSSGESGEAVPVSETTSSTGEYVVEPGDTLTAIAARDGVSMNSLASANGLNPDGLLISGTALRLQGTPSASGTAESQPVGAPAEGNVTNPPYPTDQVLSASQIAQIASDNNVSPSLADAIAWQESGFNNDEVSSADARGIMQILPGTWQWIQDDLNTGTPLAPASAMDNVRGGVLMLHSLLNSTGGDPAMAAAGYYQGLPSVQQHGLYADTQQYVNSVMSLRDRFGGG